MKNKRIHIGNSIIETKEKEVKGQFVEIAGEKFYKINHFDLMPDFFISIVSNSDHWMFISSNGALTAGRKDRNNALFPYYTEDKIHDYKGKTGNSSYFKVIKENQRYLWIPFSDAYKFIYNTESHLYKSIYGNKIIFEEINHDLDLKFQYGWYNSEKFGFVKKSKIENIGSSIIIVEFIDGIQNILPSGIDYNFQNEYSNLLDAYKKNELLKDSLLGIFSLSSIPVDRAEPSESLKATTVWNIGLENPTILISTKQINNFIKGNKVNTEFDIRASRGAYFVSKEIELTANSEQQWMIVAELNQDSAHVSNTNYFLQNTTNIEALVESDISVGTNDLKKKVSSADGFQLTNTDLCYARHYSNTLYNIMRGGIFTDNYQVEISDFKIYLQQINRNLSEKYNFWINIFPEKVSYIELIQKAKETGNNDLIRITYEYLPLTFSRRHGDPSRPWNLFSIETRNEDGSVKYNYQGNWRDIFQNWEALAYSFPEYIEGMISKFVNASTIDGYNPYRIMRDGIDWESPDPDDPWAYIGYWGDHQIIYLQKFLELSHNFHPGRLSELLTMDIFTYANVPYRIKSYEEILKNPKDTIVFDYELNKQIIENTTSIGADAKLLCKKGSNTIYRVNLTEKVLVTLLSKISNFIPDAGIWLNTQRPEWNDANNALVGNGTSMVTLYYLRRFLDFWEKTFANTFSQEISVSEEIASLFEIIHSLLNDYKHLLEKGFSNTDRRKFAEYLGLAGSKYRNGIYENSFSGQKKSIHINSLAAFMNLAKKYIDQSIRNNKREDGLYHAYNLINIDKEEISIRYLYEMIEGQVAVLSSGYLPPNESLDVLNALKNSKIFREDQYSYLLYPDRVLRRFNEKNIIPKYQIKSSELLQKLLENNNRDIINRDIEGHFHFNSNFRNADNLKIALQELRSKGYNDLIYSEENKILGIYEEVFDHQSFTGRSGTFYGYEGLGSIYWHMVSKLLLATQECYYNALDKNADAVTIGKLKEHYYEIKAGIGLYKSPDVYGAFPTDAYSHTPANAGVKQPGLTGQVKEDVISRFGEMGIRIIDGNISFDASLLNEEEILTVNKEFKYYNCSGTENAISLKKNEIGFTFCQVPIVYKFTNQSKMIIYLSNNTTEEIIGNTLNKHYSHLIFSRNNEVNQIDVYINK